MQLEQIVSVAIRLIASFYLVQHVLQITFSAPAAFGMLASSSLPGASSLVVLSPLIIVVVEIVAFAKSRALAQWIIRGA